MSWTQRREGGRGEGKFRLCSQAGSSFRRDNTPTAAAPAHPSAPSSHRALSRKIASFTDSTHSFIDFTFHICHNFFIHNGGKVGMGYIVHSYIYKYSYKDSCVGGYYVEFDIKLASYSLCGGRNQRQPGARTRSVSWVVRRSVGAITLIPQSDYSWFTLYMSCPRQRVKLLFTVMYLQVVKCVTCV